MPNIVVSEIKSWVENSDQNTANFYVIDDDESDDGLEEKRSVWLSVNEEFKLELTLEPPYTISLSPACSEMAALQLFAEAVNASGTNESCYSVSQLLRQMADLYCAMQKDIRQCIDEWIPSFTDEFDEWTEDLASERETIQETVRLERIRETAKALYHRCLQAGFPDAAAHTLSDNFSSFSKSFHTVWTITPAETAPLVFDIIFSPDATSCTDIEGVLLAVFGPDVTSMSMQLIFSENLNQPPRVRLVQPRFSLASFGGLSVEGFIQIPDLSAGRNLFDALHKIEFYLLYCMQQWTGTEKGAKEVVVVRETSGSRFPNRFQCCALPSEVMGHIFSFVESDTKFRSILRSVSRAWRNGAAALMETAVQQGDVQSVPIVSAEEWLDQISASLTRKKRVGVYHIKLREFLVHFRHFSDEFCHSLTATNFVDLPQANLRAAAGAGWAPFVRMLHVEFPPKEHVVLGLWVRDLSETLKTHFVNLEALSLGRNHQAWSSIDPEYKAVHLPKTMETALDSEKPAPIPSWMAFQGDPLASLPAQPDESTDEWPYMPFRGYRLSNLKVLALHDGLSKIDSIVEVQNLHTLQLHDIDFRKEDTTFDFWLMGFLRLNEGQLRILSLKHVGGLRPQSAAEAIGAFLPQLTELTLISAGRSNWSCLSSACGPELRSLRISNVELDASFWASLASRSPSLELLSLGDVQPKGPETINELKKLRALEVRYCMVFGSHAWDLLDCLRILVLEDIEHLISGDRGFNAAAVRSVQDLTLLKLPQDGPFRRLVSSMPNLQSLTLPFEVMSLDMIDAINEAAQPTNSRLTVSWLQGLTEAFEGADSKLFFSEWSDDVRSTLDSRIRFGAPKYSKGRFSDLRETTADTVKAITKSFGLRFHRNQHRKEGHPVLDHLYAEDQVLLIEEILELLRGLVPFSIFPFLPPILPQD